MLKTCIKPQVVVGFTPWDFINSYPSIRAVWRMDENSKEISAKMEEWELQFPKYV